MSSSKKSISAKNKIILSNLLSPESDKKAHWLPGYGIWLERKGLSNKYFIKAVSTNEELEIAAKKLKSVDVINKKNNILTPSFCDLHFHWVQDDVRDMPKDDLLFWLKNYTWPTESNFKSLEKSY